MILRPWSRQKPMCFFSKRTCSRKGAPYRGQNGLSHSPSVSPYDNKRNVGQVLWPIQTDMIKFA